MYRTYCDRCGQEIFVKSSLGEFFPVYRIQVKQNPTAMFEKVDLCAGCTKGLRKWMKNKEDN